MSELELTSAQKRYIASALDEARSALLSLGKDNPPGGEIVFQVIKTMIQVERRQKLRSSQSGPSSMRSLWPFAIDMAAHRSEADKWEDLKQRRAEAAAGVPLELVYNISFVATPREIATAETVGEVFRPLMVGKNPTRDWKIVNYLALGKSIRAVSRILHIGKTRVDDCRRMQCGAIWARVGHLMPSKGNGKVWTEEEAA